MNTKRRLIFLHLPKNGGTTFNSILKKKYSEDEIFQVDFNKKGIWNIYEFKEMPQDERDNIKLLTGHINFGLHTYFSEPYRYITMLRHPVERTISFYNFIKNEKTHRLLDAVQDKSLLECVTQVQDFDVVNGQARKLSNTDNEDLMLKKALENLDQYFDFVGIQEHFDDSIKLLNHTFNWSYGHYSKLNASKEKFQADQELVDEIIKRNKVDLELYHIMNERFLKDLKNMDRFTLDKGLNSLKGRLKRIYNKLR